MPRSWPAVFRQPSKLLEWCYCFQTRSTFEQHTGCVMVATVPYWSHAVRVGSASGVSSSSQTAPHRYSSLCSARNLDCLSVLEALQLSAQEELWSEVSDHFVQNE